MLRKSCFQRIFSLLIGFVIFSGILGIEECCEECLVGLKKNKKVVVYDKPKVLENHDFEFCKNPFRNFETCCEKESLWVFTKGWAYDKKQELNQTRALISQFKSLMKYTDILLKYTEDNEKRLKKNIGKFMDKEDLDDFKNILKSYQISVFDYDQKQIAFEQDLNICYSTLTSIRINTLCLRCSSKSSTKKFFEKKKIKIKERTCSKIMIDCGRVFSLLAEVTTFYARFKQIREINLKKGLSGVAKGLRQIDLIRLSLCANNLAGCLDNRELLQLNCERVVALFDKNVEVEGDLETWEHGYRMARDILMKSVDLADLKGDDKGSGKIERKLNDLGMVAVDEKNGVEIEKIFNSSVKAIGDFDKSEAVVLLVEQNRVKKFNQVLLVFSSPFIVFLLFVLN